MVIDDSVGKSQFRFRCALKYQLKKCPRQKRSARVLSFGMIDISNNTYMGEIPGFEADTHVQYKIIAYDNANNPAVEDNVGNYYVYTVIPEFQKLTILIFMITTAIAIILTKTRKQPQPRLS